LNTGWLLAAPSCLCAFALNWRFFDERRYHHFD
jgi:hypothetical protein